MRRAVIALVCICALAPAPALAATGWWSKLWRNADQRGEQLLSHGDAAAAARTYADPRRRAYADLRAGNFDAAAKGFGAFDDAEADYDRGNALARAGRLQDALAAYDAALARDPMNADARHNRELVERALRQRSKSSSSQRPRSGNRSGKQRAGNGRSDSSGARGSTGKPGKSPARAAAKPSGAGGKDHAGHPQQGNQATAKRSPTGNDARRSKDTGATRRARAQASAGQHERADSRMSRMSAGQRAGATHGRQSAPAGAAATGHRPDGKPRAKPRSEQQLAEDQWLRQIPDDPGGLLRRKFLLEHLMRQRGKTS